MRAAAFRRDRLSLRAASWCVDHDTRARLRRGNTFGSSFVGSRIIRWVVIVGIKRAGARPHQDAPNTAVPHEWPAKITDACWESAGQRRSRMKRRAKARVKSAARGSGSRGCGDRCEKGCSGADCGQARQKDAIDHDADSALGVPPAIAHLRRTRSGGGSSTARCQIVPLSN